MLRGLYIAGSGMAERASNMEIVANNIANMQSNSFKRDRVVLSGFREMMLDHIQSGQKKHQVGTCPMGASAATDTYTDFTQGPLTHTGNPNDVAIDGTGFIKLERPDGAIRYTRDFMWNLDSGGVMTDRNGNTILNKDDKPIIINRNSNILINPEGEIYQNGQLVDRIGVVEFTNTNVLDKEGDSVYMLKNGVDRTSAEIEPSQTVLRQNFVEGANFSPMDAVSEMIMVLREYESSAKVLQVIDETMDMAASKLGSIQ